MFQTPSKRRTNARTDWRTKRHARVPTTSTTNAVVTPCRRRCDSSTGCKRHVSLSVRSSPRWSLTQTYKRELWR